MPCPELFATEAFPEQPPLSLAPWREPLARALHRNRALTYARYFQLATVCLDGRPANRTVVFRGFAEGCDDLMLISDRRSGKHQQILAHPWGEICWYFPKTREQFRLAGGLRIVDATTEPVAEQKLRTQVWQAISAKAREQFYGLPPGQPLQPSPSPLPQDEAEVSPPAAEFAVILLTPQTVDHLELRGNPQVRCRYELGCDCRWQSIALNP